MSELYVCFLFSSLVVEHLGADPRTREITGVQNLSVAWMGNAFAPRQVGCGVVSG